MKLSEQEEKNASKIILFSEAVNLGAPSNIHKKFVAGFGIETAYLLLYDLGTWMEH